MKPKSERYWDASTPVSIQPSAQILAQNHRCSPAYLSIWFRAAAKPMVLLSHGFSEHNAKATIRKLSTSDKRHNCVFVQKPVAAVLAEERNYELSL